MRSLSEKDILEVWENGRRQHPVGRALTMLAPALPDRTLDELAKLDVARRDSLLMALREKTFGTVLRALTECPACSENLEFPLPKTGVTFGNTEDTPPESGTIELTEEKIAWRFRLPDSTDLAAAAGHEVAEAKAIIMRRCLLGTFQGGDPVSVDALPDHIALKIVRLMGVHGREADIALDISCPACGHGYQTVFDIVSFFWSEISWKAQLLLREVHILASAYGWREADILSMSPARRHAYLEMVS